ncbi:MAG: hypothetical protein Tsb0014_01250 [Pleurocapsa sp.]
MNQPPQVLNSRWSRLYRLYNFFFRPLKNLEDYSQRYGDIFQFGNSSTPTVILSNPQAIATIFQAPPFCSPF